MTSIILAMLLMQQLGQPTQVKIYSSRDNSQKKECKITEVERKVCGSERVPVIWNDRCDYRCDKPAVAVDPPKPKGKK